MLTLSGNLAFLFFGLTSCVILWRFVRDRGWERLDFAGWSAFGKAQLAFLAPLALLFGVASGCQLSLAPYVGYFLAAAIVPALLSKIELAPFLRSLVLLCGAVVFSMLAPADGYNLACAAVLSGLILSKTIDVLFAEEPQSLEDFVPAFLLLVGSYWTKIVDPVAFLPMHQKLIVGSFIVAVFIRWIQAPSLKEDKLYVKRITLALLGGLCLLMLINKMIVAMEMAKIAVVAGAGFFLAYLFQAMESACDDDAAFLSEFKQVLFVGIFTLLISRLFGMLGLVVLAISMLVATVPSVAWLAAVFWGSRVLLDAFLYQFNSNMTGINLMHTYTGAALYGGFFLAVAISLLLRHVTDRRVLSLLFIAASFIAPISATYFLHAEPTSSLLISCLTACILLAVMSKSIHGPNVTRHHAIMLLPPQLISVAVLANELIAMGNEASSQQRITVLLVLALVTSAILWLATFMSNRNSSGEDQAEDATDKVESELPSEA